MKYPIIHVCNAITGCDEIREMTEAEYADYLEQQEQAYTAQLAERMTNAPLPDERPAFLIEEP